MSYLTSKLSVHAWEDLLHADADLIQTASQDSRPSGVRLTCSNRQPCTSDLRRCLDKSGAAGSLVSSTLSCLGLYRKPSLVNWSGRQ